MEKDREYLHDILEAARLIIQYARDKKREEFLADVQLQDAVIRRLEVIGEAARRVSEATRVALPDLPWLDMLAMRNLLIHEYDDVDADIVWDTVQQDVPELAAALENALRSGNT